VCSSDDAIIRTNFLREEIVKIQNVEVRSAVKSLFAERNGIPTDRLADPRTVARVLQGSPFCAASVRAKAEKLLREWRGLLFESQSGSKGHEDIAKVAAHDDVVDVEQLSERTRGCRWWSDDEVAALTEGIEKYGYGQWSAIKEAFSHILMNRTPEQIMYKARYLFPRPSARGPGERQQFRDESRPNRWGHEDAEPNMADSSTKRRVPVTEWTAGEMAALEHGVEMFGPGKWKQIQDYFSPELDDRNYNQISSKGHSLMRSKSAVGNHGSPDGREQFACAKPPSDDQQDAISQKRCPVPWTEDEFAALAEGIEKIGYGRWREIREAFSDRFQNRTEKAIGFKGYQFSVSKRSPKPVADKVESSQSLRQTRFCHPWTLDEEAAFREGLQEFGPGNWHQIKEKFSDRLKSRSVASLASRYYSAQFQRKTNGLQESSRQLQRWTLDEERALERAVRQVGYGDWQGIHDHFSTTHKGRTLGQIRSKADHMRNSGRFGEIVSSTKPPAVKQFWTRDEEQAIVAGVSKFGWGRWSLIQREFSHRLVGRPWQTVRVIAERMQSMGRISTADGGTKNIRSLQSARRKDSSSFESDEGDSSSFSEHSNG
jgi:Myb-like DNA-binding domain